MKIRVVLEPGEDGDYAVSVPSLPGCISEGETRQESLLNIREAIAFYLEPVDDDLLLRSDAEIIEVAVRPKCPCSPDINR